MLLLRLYLYGIDLSAVWGSEGSRVADSLTPFLGDVPI